jgi:hypothetical protein
MTARRPRPAFTLPLLLRLVLLAAPLTPRVRSDTAYVRRSTGTCGDIANGADIASAAECETAARLDGWPGYNQQTVTSVASTASGEPRGCWAAYVFDKSGPLYFNTDTASTATCGTKNCLCAVTAAACTSTDGTAANTGPCACGPTQICTDQTGLYCNADGRLCSANPIPTCTALSEALVLHTDTKLDWQKNGRFRALLMSLCGFEISKATHSTSSSSELWHAFTVDNDCVCANGNARTSANSPGCTTHGANECASCNGAYHLEGADDCTANVCTCAANVCTCADGVPHAGAACTAHNANNCASCTGAFHLEGSACAANVCTCDDGTEVVGANCTTHQAHMCVGCNTGWHFNATSLQCDANMCHCPVNGTAPTGAGCTSDNATVCETCFAGSTLNTTTLLCDLD